MGADAPTMKHVYRQRSSLGLAAVCAATLAILLLSLARNWADYPRPVLVAWVLFGLAATWAIFVRPAVLLDVGGVTVRNVVRDVHIPWMSLTDVQTRWNLKVFAGDRGFTAWAISSQVERPKRASAEMFGTRAPRPREKQRGVDAARSATPEKVTAAAIARSIEQAKQEYDEAVAHGRLPGAADSGVSVTWVPWVMAVLLVPAVAVVVLSLA
jgi:Bacterial PH domain